MISLSQYSKVLLFLVTICFQPQLCSVSVFACVFLTSAVLVQIVPVRNRPVACLPVLLLAAFSRTAHPNNVTLDTALLWVLSNTPAKCEVNRMNGCQDN